MADAEKTPRYHGVRSSTPIIANTIGLRGFNTPIAMSATSPSTIRIPPTIISQPRSKKYPATKPPRLRSSNKPCPTMTRKATEAEDLPSNCSPCFGASVYTCRFRDATGKLAPTQDATLSTLSTTAVEIDRL